MTRHFALSERLYLHPEEVHSKEVEHRFDVLNSSNAGPQKVDVGH